MQKFPQMNRKKVNIYIYIYINIYIYIYRYLTVFPRTYPQIYVNW